MSGKKPQGQGAAPPAPTPETPPAESVTQPIAPETLTASTPVGTLPADPFEPPLPIPLPELVPDPALVREQLEKLTADQKLLEEDRESLEKQRQALEEAREQLEKDREALRENHGELADGFRELSDGFEALRRGEPPPRAEVRLVQVRAIKGVIDDLRVQHRNPGEIFRMREDLAETLEDRGEVEIL